MCARTRTPCLKLGTERHALAAFTETIRHGHVGFSYAIQEGRKSRIVEPGCIKGHDGVLVGIYASDTARTGRHKTKHYEIIDPVALGHIITIGCEVPRNTCTPPQQVNSIVAIRSSGTNG